VKLRVTRKLPPEVEDRLVASYDTTLNPGDAPLTQDALRAAMCKFDILVTTVSDQIDAALLRTPGRRVRMIANVGIGVSNIDTEAASAAGVFVSNTPDVVTDATADVAMLLILSATRRSYAAETMLRQKQWGAFSLVGNLGTSMQGKTLGIVGMGRIGQATARRAVRGFGMKVIYYNRSDIAAPDFPATRVDTIDAVMRTADVVSIHVPGGGGHPLVTAAHIGAMRPHAYLINTARGDSVDQDALVHALTTGAIAGAGLDVFANEPQVPEALLSLHNATLLPHIGTATTEVRTAMANMAADNVDAFAAARRLPNEVVGARPKTAKKETTE